MTYKILSTRQIKEILFTHVEFTFSFGVMEIEIPHFFPETISDEAFQTAIDYKIKEYGINLYNNEVKAQEIENKIPILEIGVIKPIE